MFDLLRKKHFQRAGKYEFRRGILWGGSQCICSLKLVKNHCSIQFSCEPLNVMSAHSSKSQVHISSAVSPFFLSSSFSCQRFGKDDPESVQKYRSSVGTCTPAVVHRELVTLWSQALCSVISREEVPSSSNGAGGFGDPFSQLQLVFGASRDE